MPSPRPALTGPAKTFRDTVQPFVRKYCVECHGNDTTNGGVNFESLGDFSSAVAARKTWDKARKMLETAAMPPADHPTRPNETEIADVRPLDQPVGLRRRLRQGPRSRAT